MNPLLNPQMETYDCRGFIIILGEGGGEAIPTGHESMKHALMSINEFQYRRKGQRHEICQH